MTAYFPYTLLTRSEMIQRVNELSTTQSPFLFIIDYKAIKGFVIPTDKIDEKFIKFDFDSFENNDKTSEEIKRKSKNCLGCFLRLIQRLRTEI